MTSSNGSSRRFPIEDEGYVKKRSRTVSPINNKSTQEGSSEFTTRVTHLKLPQYDAVSDKHCPYTHTKKFKNLLVKIKKNEEIERNKKLIKSKSIPSLVNLSSTSQNSSIQEANKDNSHLSTSPIQTKKSYKETSSSNITYLSNSSSR